MNELSAGEYFPFGQEGQRLKVYVQEQLNGQQTKKRAEILKQFQKEAEARRHHYMRFHRLSQGIESSDLSRQRYHTLEPQSLENSIQKTSFDQISNPKLRYPLIPAEKKKPPIYRFSSPGQYCYPNYLSIPVNINKKVTGDNQKGRVVYHELQRTSNILRPQGNKHRNWALRKIKQSAFKIRQKQKNGESQYSQGQGLIKELQEYHKRAKIESETLGRRLKKLKKYRMYIKDHQSKKI